MMYFTTVVATSKSRQHITWHCKHVKLRVILATWVSL